MGARAGLVYYDPKTANVETWFPPSMRMHESYFWWVGRSRRYYRKLEIESGKTINALEPTTRLMGKVTALATRGDYLFVATQDPDVKYYSSDGISFISVMHKPSRKWIGSIKAPKSGRINQVTVNM